MMRRTAQALGFASVRLRSRPIGGRAIVVLGDPQFSCTTSVVRLPRGLGRAVHRVASGIPGIEEHYLYPASDLHLTVANLDASPLGEKALGDRVAQAAAGFPPFQVELRGVAMTALSVYAQVWDFSGELWRLRAAVEDRASIRLPAARRLLGFVNVARFLRPSVGVVRTGVRNLGHTNFGRLTVREVEVVRTDKVLSGEGTRLISLARLGPGAAPEQSGSTPPE
ncbi:MAG: hypothetical protein QM582_14965 [Micropruina sp.]|uniref:2'-5' RNA ligase family protein n=1 Tax=Micropruina sp. TaxID=2737536 RepID=UPI0039E671A9